MESNDEQRATPNSLPAVPAHLAGKFKPEQWAKRQALAAKLKGFSTDGAGRPLRPVAMQVRFTLVFIVCGLGLLLGGLGSFFGIVRLSNLPVSPDAGWLRLHGGELLAMVIGICFLAAGIRTILNSRKTAEEEAGAMRR